MDAAQQQTIDEVEKVKGQYHYGIIKVRKQEKA